MSECRKENAEDECRHVLVRVNRFIRAVRASTPPVLSWEMWRLGFVRIQLSCACGTVVTSCISNLLMYRRIKRIEGEFTSSVFFTFFTLMKWKCILLFMHA